MLPEFVFGRAVDFAHFAKAELSDEALKISREVGRFKSPITQAFLIRKEIRRRCKTADIELDSQPKRIVGSGVPALV